MGVSDPMRLLQTLPAVATNNDLSAGISVEGCDHSHNLSTVDGMEIVNPSHMLGLFSVFNMDHFKSVRMQPNFKSAESQNFLGASIDAITPSTPDTLFRGKASLGIVEANTSLAIPVSKNVSSLVVSARRSMIDIVYPGILKFDHAKLNYRFADLNTTYTQRLHKGWSMKGNLFFSTDRLRMTDSYYDSKGNFSWRNLDGSVSFNNSHNNHILAFADYRNNFTLTESSSTLKLPSGLFKVNYRGTVGWHRFLFGAEASLRRVDRQKPQTATIEHNRNEWTDNGIETSLSASHNNIWRNLATEIGLKTTLYDNDGYTRLFPQPRFKATLKLPGDFNLSGSYGIYTQFTHLIKESGTGLPVDFWINASHEFPAQTSHSTSLSFAGPLFDHNLLFSVEGYYRTFSNVVEFDGGLLNMVNSVYDPLSDVICGRGRAYGVSLTLMREIGKLRGWLGYNFGKSENRFPTFGKIWFPSDHDRRHDLKATLMWNASERWNFSATFVHATGTPYTRAAYGYIIGENFICEYFPHNSSRLPNYNRLDLSADFRIGDSKHDQRLNFSIFNALFNHNVIFTYITYSPKNGLTHRKTGLKTAIPSVSYSLSF